MGTTLLLRSAWYETLVALQGGSTVMEHPADVHGPPCPTAWQTPIFAQYHAALPNFRKILTEQWQHGAVGRKPTTLKVIGLTTLPKALQDCADPAAVRPTKGLIGQTTDGQWATAGAKQYPRRLCKALALAIVKEVLQRWQRGETRSVTVETQDTRWRFLKQASRTAAASRRTHWLPDYQGH